MDSTAKTCRVCSQEKRMVDFYFKANNRDRRDTVCKSCKKIMQINYRVSSAQKRTLAIPGEFVPRRRIPAWLTREDWLIMATIYQSARHLTVVTGIKHVVDHIIPMNGELVSGLHVPDNLQVISDSDNSMKNSRYTP